MLVALIVIELVNLAAIALLARFALTRWDFYIEQLDAAIGEIKDAITANRGLTENDANLITRLLRIGRRHVSLRTSLVLRALGVEEGLLPPERSPSEKAMLAACAAELEAAGV